jgi:hypothetical protein
MIFTRLIARKTVSFSLSENYDFLPSLLGFRRIETSNPSLALSEENIESSIWCIRQDLNLQPSDPKSEALSN